jgi:hypothetical protein
MRVFAVAAYRAGKWSLFVHAVAVRIPGARGAIAGNHINIWPVI